MATAFDDEPRGYARDERSGDVSALAGMRKLLAESDARFWQLAEGLPHYVFTSDAEGQCDFLSQRWATYTGAPVRAQLGMAWLDVVHPDDRERVRAAWQRAVREGTNFRTDMRLRRHDGAYRWFEARASALRDDTGRIVKWYGSHADTHETVEQRAALEHEQERLQRILATAPGVFVSLRKEPDGRLTLPLAAPGLLELSGLAPESIRDDVRLALARVHPDDLPSVLEAIDHSSRMLTPWRGEYRYLHPTQGERWLEGHLIPQREPDGAVQWFGFLRDFTDRRSAEESLKHMQSQLVAALDASGMGLSIWDVAPNRLWMDDALLKLLGRQRAELRGSIEDVLDFTHADDRARVRELLDGLGRDGAEHDFDLRVVRPDGGVRWLSVRARPELDRTGRVVRVSALHLDATVQKRAAEAHLRSQKLEALGTLAGGIAHDFNNILQAIVGNTALALGMLPPGHEARAFLEGIGAASGRASDLVRRILAFSHGEEPEKTTLQLDETVGEALKLVRATLPAQIEISREQADEPLPIVADASQIHQLIVNLATNAAHAIGPDGGRIQVRVARATLAGPGHEHGGAPPQGNYAVLHVTDSGCGMTPETVARVFDPFFTTKPVGHGTGLGLSVVHGIMKSLGGAVTVYSEPGQGTTFSLYFPLARAAPESSRPSGDARARGQGARVLFVDDEEILVTLGMHILESLGYVATGFSDPAEALCAFAGAPDAFDVVVTDVSMPGMSGFELTERMLAQRRDVPVLMMSGYVGPDELDAAERLGVRELLLKPVSIDELGRALSRLLGSQGKPALQTT